MMKSKIAISFIIMLISLCTFQYSWAASNYTDSSYYYKDNSLGILAYKQVNAFKLSLADGSILADATISTTSGLDTVEDMKKVEIVFVIDTSGSMQGTKENTTKDSTKTLVNALYDKLGSENLKIGIIYFNSKMDTDKILNLTNDKSAILNHLDKIYASGSTYMATSLAKAEEMLKNTGTDDNVVKIVCTLSDGILHDEANAISQFRQIIDSRISTMSIFVETPISNAFKNLATQYPTYHKNFQTTTANLANTIANDIYNEIYTKLITLLDPQIVYNISNAGIIAGDNKIIIEADEEILHGATLEVEYILSITSSFDSKNIKMTDLYCKDFVFSRGQKLLTENKTNGDYGWRIEAGSLITDSGSNVINGSDEYKVKLVLSTVLTPTRLRELNKLDNYATFKLNRVSDNQEINITENNTDTDDSNIKALRIVILPPTGTSYFEDRIVWTLNITVLVVSIALIIICIIDYVKTKRKK